MTDAYVTLGNLKTLLLWFWHVHPGEHRISWRTVAIGKTEDDRQSGSAALHET